MPDSNTLLATWYQNRRPWLSLTLLPLAWFFGGLSALRRAYFRTLGKPTRLPIPVLVVGNITLGGSGKSPLLITLAARLKAMGYSPGIVSRGYGSQAPYYPFPVDATSKAEEAGDEPLMIAQRSGCPVMIGAKRREAAEQLIATQQCDVILSDDGLQHYGLPRDLEIIVVDGQRRLGNERLLPAGPLREAVRRLRQADWVVVNSAEEGDLPELEKRWGLERIFAMQLRPRAWRRLVDDAEVDVKELRGKTVHALAGIGNPQRFFTTLEKLGMRVEPHPLADHHNFRSEDLKFADDLTVVMTEKDAVKCRRLVSASDPRWQNYYYLSVDAALSDDFIADLQQRLQACQALSQPR